MGDIMSRWLTAVGFGVLMICASVSCEIAHAQTVSGTIVGIIKDQQGAAVAGAEVSSRSVETGAIRKTTANNDGTYRIPSVPAGVYEVTATASGFKSEVRSGVAVTVGGDISVDFSLTVGTVSEKVDVVGEAPQVDATSSAMGGFVNSGTIRELPLNGRDWLQLALLQPGAVFNSTQPETASARPKRGNGLAISISGGRPTDNAYQIDGLVVNDYANSGPGSALRVNMGVDAILEFSVLTDNYSAEYGRGSGGIVNAITKSGTNEVHGTGYYFLRNSALDARNFFDPLTIPPFRRSQFGGAVGGPIKKDKTFFFTNYEGLHELQSASSNVTTLSANVHNGILCGNTACTQTTQVAIAPSVIPYLSLFPMPNGAVSGNTGVYAYGAPTLGQENYVIGKIDHYFSASTTLSGSYTYDNTTVTTPDNFDLLTANSPSRRQNVILSLQHIFSPTVINNVRVGVSRTYSAENIDVASSNPDLSNPALGFFPGENMGNISISGVTGVFGGVGSGLALIGPNVFAYTSPQAADDLSWTKGRHSLRVGFNFERIEFNLNSGSKPLGIWTFPSVQSFLQGTPSQFQGVLPGTNGIFGERNSVIAGYIQDDFRIRTNLTLNLGVRYEMGTVVDAVNGRISNLRNLTDPTMTVGEPYYHNPTLKDFAPRLGFAWDPFKDGKTAVRGGFAIFNIVPLPYLFTTKINTTPFDVIGSVTNPPASSFPNQILPILSSGTATGSHIQFNPSPSYKAQWNFNIQRQLTRTLALTAGYVGSVGVHLAHTVDDTDQVPPSLVTFSSALDAYVFPVPAAGTKIQRINPNFGSITSTEWSGHSSYDALQMNLVQRPVRGLTYQVAYTWSKSIDNGSDTLSDQENANTTGAPWAFCTRCNRGVSDFDVPQNLVANFQYTLPVPQSIKTHAVTNTILGGWQAGGIYTIQSGAPFSLKIGGDQADTGNSQVASASGGQRPMYVNAPGCSPDAVTGNINDYIMIQCFAEPAPGVLGNLGRNTLRVPTFRDLDFSLFKNQNLWGERLKMQFRAEMFNILNNVNLQAQLLTIFNGSGQLVPTVVNAQGATVNTARQIQFGLKLIF
jgi:hypothetical protein